MPSVKAGESEQAYVSRCIAELVGNEGYDKEQAAAVCYSKYREAKKTIEGMSTGEGLVTQPKCDDCEGDCKEKSIPPVIDDGGTDIYGTIRRKTMTPEEAAAAQQGQGQAQADPNAPPTEDAPGSDEPPSVQVSKAVYTSLKNLMGNLKAAENTYENPEAKEYFNGPFAEKCNEAMGEIKGLISKLGSGTDDDFAPDDSSGEMEGGGEGDGAGEGGDGKKKPNKAEKEAEDEEEAMKSFLALGQTQPLKLLGIAAPLKAIAKAKNLTNEQRLSLNGVLKSITGLCDDAKKNSEEAKQKAVAAQVSSLQETQASLAKSLSALQASVAELLPR